MIIELFGLPASGKSTLARSLDARGLAKRMRITSRTELLSRSSWWIVTHPLASFMQLCYLIRYAGSCKLLYTKFVNLFLQHAAKYQKAHASGGVVIVDQGFLQNLLSLFEEPQPSKTLKRYLSWLPKPDQVWVCEASTVERVRRLNARKQEDKTDMQRKTAAATNYEMILELLEASMLPVRRVDASQDPEAFLS